MTMILTPEVFLGVVQLTPLVSVDLVVRNRAGQVLVGLRANRPAQNCWFVPGGRVCKDERIAEAIERVSESELGIRVGLEQARFLGVYEHLYEDNFAGQPGFGTHYIVLAHEIVLDGPLPESTDNQHAAFRWMDVAELLASPDVHENTKAYFTSEQGEKNLNRQ